MLKLGRAQGVAIAAAIHRDIPIHEYAPLKIKMAITGQGQASKEQVAGMLKRMLKLSDEDMPKFMDATDALGAAYCHFLQMGRQRLEGFCKPQPKPSCWQISPTRASLRSTNGLSTLS